MGTVITFNGTAAAVPRAVVPLRLVPYVRGGVGSFTFATRGGPVPPVPDPYSGKTVQVTVNGTLRFAGQVADRHPTFVEGLGWTTAYQCVDLRGLGDWVPHTDSITGLDGSTYNAQRDNDPLRYVAARAGRNVGQILTDVLTMTTNAQLLNGYGIGQYTGLPSAPALPSATTTDLAAMTFVPPSAVTFGGSKLLSAIDDFLGQWAPWYCLRVKPDGTLRFLDLRSFTNHTLTLDSDPIRPTPLSRETSGCAGQVIARGSPVAEMFLFSTATGNNGLSEAPFAWGSYTVAQAKANWTPADWRQPGLIVGSPGDDHGSCTCGTTTTVTVTSANASQTWAANYWDQTSTGHGGTLFLAWSTGTDITTYATRTITANTALAAGSTSTLTVDRALPHLNFDSYVITGSLQGPSAVWCVYQLPSWAAAKVAPQSTAPFAYRQSSGASLSLTSTALGTVLWGTAPNYSYVTTPIAVDTVTGYVHFNRPTWMTAGNQAPAIVRALVPIYTDVNTVTSPSGGGYAGKFYTQDGVSRTLYVTVPGWRDPANKAAMQTWCDQLLTSVQDPVEEGQVTYLGLYETALEMGVALSIAGNGYSTPWATSALPVVECQLEWGCLKGDALDHVTTMRVSSRKAHFSYDAFLKPDRTGVTFDWSGTIGPGDYAAAAGQAASSFAGGAGQSLGQADAFARALGTPGGGRAGPGTAPPASSPAADDFAFPDAGPAPGPTDFAPGAEDLT